MYENYFIDGKRFSLEGYEPLEQIYKDEHPHMIIMKSAQCGASEYCIGFSFYFPLHYSENVFYGMPAKDQIKDYVQGRVDPRIDESVRLQELIVSTDNTDLKRVGMNFIYFRGSQNRKQIKSVDAGCLILDEFDEMIQNHISIMEKRLGDSLYKIRKKISVPSHLEYGIHREWLGSDQHEYHLQCPTCKQWQIPAWDKNIWPAPTRERSAKTPDKVMLICCHCKTELDRKKPGKWIAMNPEAEKRGYRISKLIMPKTDLRELWIEYRDTINLQDFYNGNLGLPFAAEGGKLDDQILNACRRSEEEDKEFKKIERLDNCTMGVDIGNKINVRVSKKIKGKKEAVYIGTMKEFEDLDRLMNKYDVRRCVVDGLPETREATKFAERFPGRVFLAYYQLNDPHKTFEFKKKEKGTKAMKVLINRVRAMDETANRFIERLNRIPRDANLIPEYYDQLKAPQKVKVVNKSSGNEEHKYVENNKPDHYFHAEVYDDVADQKIQGNVEFL